jgi:hypothetical protein
MLSKPIVQTVDFVTNAEISPVSTLISNTKGKSSFLTNDGSYVHTASEA